MPEKCGKNGYFTVFMNEMESMTYPNTGLKAAVHNLGCKVNSYELDVMTQRLRAHGYEIVPFEEFADVYVVNTCTVTNIADRKSRQMLHRAKKINPDALVVAVGCYVETDREKIEQDPAIDLAIGNGKKGEIAQILEEFLTSNTGGGKTKQEDTSLLTAPGHTRAYIKIQDGCNQFCTYCIIPYARGRIRSREEEEIITEIRGLAMRGVKEVVLTGIHISSYGKDRGEDPGEALLRLITRIQLLQGIQRIRLGSLEPRLITETFAKRAAQLTKLCPHFHLSLQSGCDETLRRMNRHYTSSEYLRSVALLRSVYEHPAITTDVIVGFPGESEEEFAVTKGFLQTVNFYEIHVFKYSVRRGTVAAKLPDQVSEPVKAARSDVLLELTSQQAQEYREALIGREEEILVEELICLRVDGNISGEGEALAKNDMPGRGMNSKKSLPADDLTEAEFYTGHTSRYVECLIPAALAPAGQDIIGSMLRGRIAGMKDGRCILEPMTDPAVQ